MLEAESHRNLADELEGVSEKHQGEATQALVIVGKLTSFIGKGDKT